MRRSLLTRSLVFTVIIAVGAIGATAWLATLTATRGISQEAGHSLSDTARVYDALLHYATTHANWDEVSPLVDELAFTTGQRIVMTTDDGSIIADSSRLSPPLLPKYPSATVDPLNVASSAEGTVPIDPRVVGPFALTDIERGVLTEIASKMLDCVQNETGAGRVETLPNGRPRVVGVMPDGAQSQCGTDHLDATKTATEDKALAQLTDLSDACLAARGLDPVTIGYGLQWQSGAISSVDVGTSAGAAPIQRCVTESRRIQLRPYVPSPARLYVTDLPANAPPPFTLSQENVLRIVAVSGAVLLAAIGLTTAASVRMIRPLRALTAAAKRMRDGDATTRVTVTGKDEIAELGQAFNALTAERQRMEHERRTMISDIAHELRTPLTNIRGWLEASQDGITHPDLTSSLLEEAEQLQHIIDDLQDLTLADAGMLQMHRRAVSMTELTDQIVSAHTVRAAAAGVTIITRVGPELHAQIDPVRIKQAVDNLMTNAIRHTPHGGEVTLSAFQAASDLTIQVQDTGTGINESDLSQVFDRFWRADKSRSREAGGSGLGLAIVKRIAEAHGGFATAETPTSGGALLTIQIPASDSRPS